MARSRQAWVETLGGPTVVVEYGGLRLLTDPTFDEPGEYPTRGTYSLVKTAPPSRRPAEIGEIDVVLLSHDQHPDNLDRAGRDALPRARRVLSTASAGQRLGGASTPLIPGEYLTLTSAQAAEATRILDVASVIVVHTDSWAHFTENADDVRTAFAAAGLSDRLVGCEPGLAIEL
jgi:L-ascorbate metabolism protein UlaG (beta-lactamase superfamily)